MRFGSMGRALCVLVISAGAVSGLDAQSSAGNDRAVAPGALHKGPIDAPVTVVEFSDFECPFCAKVPAALKELESLYPNAIRFVFKHSPLDIHPNAPLAHEAALAAGAQGKFWEMHDLLFANQKQLQRDDLVKYASHLGLDVREFSAALDDHRFKPLVDQDAVEARALGVSGTPTFFINGRRVNGLPSPAALRAQVEMALGITPATTLPAVEIRPTDVTLDGSPVLGLDSAPVTIVEFSDLQCPFCARTLPVLHELLRAYPRDVKLVFKHFPLDIHDDAPLAHQAAVAAGAQGKFWEMHDAVFATQRAIKRADLIAIAKVIGLNSEQFVADLDSGRFKAKVDADKAEGKRLAVGGTPTFFINGRRLSGAKSAADFKVLIDAALKEPAWTAGSAPDAADAAAAATVSRGNPLAPVEVVWFSDLRGGLTPKTSQLVNDLLTRYGDRIRVTFKHRPVALRADSKLAHEGAAAAGAQDKFWDMHDLLVAAQGTITRERLVEFAARLKLDPQRYAADLAAATAAVDRDLDEARRRDVRGTPVFFVNGHRIDGVQPIAVFERAIDSELAAGRVPQP